MAAIEKSIREELQRICVQQYRDSLNMFANRPKGRGGFSKKQIDDMTAAYEDGFSQAIVHMIKMGVLEVM